MPDRIVLLGSGNPESAYRLQACYAAMLIPIMPVVLRVVVRMQAKALGKPEQQESLPVRALSSCPEEAMLDLSRADQAHNPLRPLAVADSESLHSSTLYHPLPACSCTRILSHTAMWMMLLHLTTSALLRFGKSCVQCSAFGAQGGILRITTKDIRP